MVDLSLVPRDMISGSEPPILRTGRVDLGVAISYENLFPRIGRQATQLGAELLVVPTLASSYASDEIPTQQLAAARIRARENGRDLAIVGSTGPTALIRADGSVAVRAPLDEPHVARATLNGRSATTAYTRYGDIPVLAASTLGLLLPARRKARTRWSHRRDREPVGHAVRSNASMSVATPSLRTTSNSSVRSPSRWTVS